MNSRSIAMKTEFEMQLTVVMWLCTFLLALFLKADALKSWNVIKLHYKNKYIYLIHQLEDGISSIACESF